MTIKEISLRFKVPYCYRRTSCIAGRYGYLYICEKKFMVWFTDFARKTPFITSLKRDYGIKALREVGLRSVEPQGMFGFLAEIDFTAIECALTVIGAFNGGRRRDRFGSPLVSDEFRPMGLRAGGTHE